MQGANLHTGDRSKPVCTEVAVQIGSERITVEVWCSQETSTRLRKDDWARVRERVTEHMERVVRRAVLSGAYFAVGCAQQLRDEALRVAKLFAYDQLKRNTAAAGIEAVQVDSLLAGERYNVA